MALGLRTFEQVLNGEKQVVPVSQTGKVVSNAFEISNDDSTQLLAQVTAVSVTGTAGIVKLQGSMDSVTWFDLDTTNLIVTVASASSFRLRINPYVAALVPSLPLPRYLRWAAVTSAAQSFTITSILTQLVKQ